MINTKQMLPRLLDRHDCLSSPSTRVSPIDYHNLCVHLFTPIGCMSNTTKYHNNNPQLALSLIVFCFVMHRQPIYIFSLKLTNFALQTILIQQLFKIFHSLFKIFKNRSYLVYINCSFSYLPVLSRRSQKTYSDNKAKSVQLGWDLNWD